MHHKYIGHDNKPNNIVQEETVCRNEIVQDSVAGPMKSEIYACQIKYNKLKSETLWK